MFRFAINNSTRRCFALSSSSKPSLSTLSCNLALSSDDTCMSSGNNTYTPSTVVAAYTASITNTIQSPLCNIIAKLSGDATSLASLDCSLSHNNHNNIIWADAAAISPNLPVFEVEEGEEEEETTQSLSLWLISTLKRRKKMMNKHKLRKRRKKLRLKTRK